ncbi:hypothetical protein J2X31_003281 [Flavobacterium arsenatis]|uniref:LPS export ABC transporter periplasmic protein LptC n=1 Tax=Flavobacterium arsenatis TaxID=1484332 RepID=A0ABU1TTP9_9FLAO|nr:hypothetical protein [Flavobacterium arsenatis]MDR6969254.1 hypothetical protein [Flavobacterium arsenatis]
MKKLLALIILSFLLMKCNNYKQIRIESQELIYDSLNNNHKLFDLKLYTTLSFEKNMTKKDFFLIISKDTFPLIKIDSINHSSKEKKIEFFTTINLKTDVFVNDSLSLIVSKNKIITSDGRIISRSKAYNFKSLMTFRNNKLGEGLDM